MTCLSTDTAYPFEVQQVSTRVDINMRVRHITKELAENVKNSNSSDYTLFSKVCAGSWDSLVWEIVCIDKILTIEPQAILNTKFNKRLCGSPF